MNTIFPKLRIGHITDLVHQTGLTVFLPDAPVRCGRWICGAAPASRDCDLLTPDNLVDTIDAILFTGGSAFGLDAAQGVMRWLKENQRGWPTYFGPVPIVPTASIYDFHEKNPTIPSADDAYHACCIATYPLTQQGNVGAATGARIGKLLPDAKSMLGGFGFAHLTTPAGLLVTAFAVVNCVGDVFSKDKIIAGARDPNGRFANTREHLLKGKPSIALVDNHAGKLNTTLVATFTNARFNKTELTRIAKMASSGIAQAICPAFTAYDGDMVFCVSTDEFVAEEITVATLSAEATRQAIIQAVSQ